MQIRTLFPVCTFALAAVAACTGGWLLTQAVIDDTLVERLERAVEIDTLWFKVADAVASERPQGGNLLLDDRPAKAAALAALAATHDETDRAIVAVEQHIGTAPGADRQLDIVRSTHQDMASLRERARSNFSLPRSERDPDIFAHYVAEITDVLERVDTALDLGDIEAARQDGETMDLIALSRQAWLVPGFAGARIGAVISALQRGVPLTAGEIERQIHLEGQVVAGRAAIEALVRRLSDHPALTGMVASALDALRQYDDLCEIVISASREGRLPAISALEFGTRASPIGPVLVGFRDAALASARNQVVHHRQVARARVALSATAVLLIMVATIWTIRLLKQRIVSPMLALTETIGRLARRDYDVEVPAQEQSDEIGDMAGALETLRQGAIVAAENEAQIAYMACHDALTGLANRTLLQDRMDQMIALAGRGEISAVLCLDLDRFKAVNDTFGHPVGDLLLRAVADRLSACAREIDTVSRLGGDEFVVLMVGLDCPEDASILAQRIVTTLNQPFDLDGQIVSVGVSVGIAIAPQDATTAVSLLKNSDTALYRAKLEEKGSFRYFKPEMNVELMARVELERDLREAIRTEAFELHYQPQFTLTDTRLCGFEALLRWRHPVRGLVSAGEFIPVAEDTGLIVPIGAWALRQACRDAVDWPDHLSVAVNLSAVQFKNRVLIETVREALAESGMPAVRLHLEITEAALLTNSTATLDMLHEMREIGTKIAMDDFGTGYSSLSYLRKFPFDCIKIDQSFVRDLAERADARAIVRAVVALGRDLGPRILAEGVETPDQLAYLRAAGCDEVQGYLLGRPIPAAQALRLAGAPHLTIGQTTANHPDPITLKAGQLSVA